MKRIRILSEKADEISARMKILGTRTVESYLALLVKHDLFIQTFRKRCGIVPFSAHQITWIELYKLICKKIRVDIKRWRSKY